SADWMYKFDFMHWEDGLTENIRFDTLTHPIVRTAYYDGKVKVRVAKSPSVDHYGWIRISDSVFYSSAMEMNWVRYGEPDTIGVSAIDFISEETGSAYVFDHWSDGGSVVHEITCTEPQTFTAFYNLMIVNLAVCIENDTVDFDTLGSTETKTTTYSMAPVVTNCGNMALDYGLSVYDPDSVWFPGYIVDANVFTLRARFEDISRVSTPVFIPLDDWVKFSRTWADDEQFGPLGYNVPEGESQRLWLQFIAPTRSSVYGTRRPLILILHFKPHLP
ncbi:hypothetical protein J7K99_05320, partial [bacterium]|nr:hypothetical protein [bacterium]